MNDIYLIWQIIKLNMRHDSNTVGSISGEHVSIDFSYRYAFSRNAERAIRAGIRDGYLEVVDEAVKITEKGINLASQDVPEWKRPKSPVMTEDLWELLNDLESWHRTTPVDYRKTGAQTLDLGGTDGSDHSRNLQKLCILGYARTNLVNGYPRPPSIYKRGKGSRRYWPTPEGEAALKEWKRK